MNYLAHIFLSGEDTQLMIGNFIADSLKGSELAIYPEGIRRGVRLHHDIDRYTDRHVLVESSKARLRSKYRKYSGVIVDIYYDHFLARNWHLYSTRPLGQFARDVYRQLNDNYALLPPRSKRFLHYLVTFDMLTNYANLDGIQQVFNGMAHRASFDSRMDEAVEELRLYEQDFEHEFSRFFEDLRGMVAKKLERRSG